MSKDKGIAAVPLLLVAIIIVITIVIIVLGYWFWREKYTLSLGSQIFKQIPKDTVSGKLPETNPFAKVNPFKGVYKNPFE